MIQKNFKNVIFKFAEETSDFSNVKHIILFGSTARGEATSRSDVDICVITSDNKTKQISEKTLDLEKKYNKNIQLVISKNFEKLDSYFIKQLLTEGILIYSKTPLIKIKNLKYEAYNIIAYSLKNLNQSKKMKIKRLFYGYKTKKKSNNKIYESSSKGLIKELNGTILGKGCFLISVKSLKQIEKFLKKYKINYNKIEILK